MSALLVQCLHITYSSLLQYVVTGVWKGLDVAIRATKQDSLDEAGLQFIEDAVTILK